MSPAAQSCGRRPTVRRPRWQRLATWTASSAGASDRTARNTGTSFSPPGCSQHLLVDGDRVRRLEIGRELGRVSGGAGHFVARRARLVQGPCPANAAPRDRQGDCEGSVPCFARTTSGDRKDLLNGPARRARDDIPGRLKDEPNVRRRHGAEVWRDARRVGPSKRARGLAARAPDRAVAKNCCPSALSAQRTAQATTPKQRGRGYARRAGVASVVRALVEWRSRVVRRS